MLATYLAATRRLLQSPAAPTSLYSDADLTTYINTARGQVAGESEGIRYLATINTVIGQRNYNFSALNTGVAATNGIRGIIHIRAIRYAVATGFRWINPRGWEWFDYYHLNNPVPTQGVPAVWAQYGQGSAGTGTGSSATGSFYLDPPPNFVYALTCDTVCYPVALVDDTTVESIPFLWTDAICYFAAYLAYLSSQTGTRQADAARMWELYEEFVGRARRFANPALNRYMYSQAPDVPSFNKLGIQKSNQQ